PRSEADGHQDRKGNGANAGRGRDHADAPDGKPVVEHGDAEATSQAGADTPGRFDGGGQRSRKDRQREQRHAEADALRPDSRSERGRATCREAAEEVSGSVEDGRQQGQGECHATSSRCKLMPEPMLQIRTVPGNGAAIVASIGSCRPLSSPEHLAESGSPLLAISQRTTTSSLQCAIPARRPPAVAPTGWTSPTRIPLLHSRRA